MTDNIRQVLEFIDNFGLGFLNKNYNILKFYTMLQKKHCLKILYPT